jgi:hypothetical protein
VNALRLRAASGGGAVFPVTAEILSPEEGGVFAYGAEVMLNGGALQGGAVLEDSALRWESDRDGDLGFGSAIGVTTLTEGNHVLTLTATGTDGQEASASVQIEIEPPLEPPVVQTQSGDLDVLEGENVELTASFTAVPEVESYQWLKDDVALQDSTRVSGTQTAVLTIQDAQVTDAGTYRLEAVNPAGTGLSGPMVLTVEELPVPGWALHLDFGDAVADPSGNWNSIAAGATHTDLVDFESGNVVAGVALDNLNTGGSGLQVSGATGVWGNRTVSPDWADALSLSDRMWISNGDSATLRFRNLDPGATYAIEIASSFAGGGSAGYRPGMFTVVGASGPVEGFNAHSGENLGTDVLWTSRGPNDGGDELAAEGWMIWPEVVADASGVIDIQLEASTDSLSRVSVNALRMRVASLDDPSGTSGNDGGVGYFGGNGGKDIQSLEDWRAYYFPAASDDGTLPDSTDPSGDLANPSGDGVPNLLKYALGLDPTTALTPAEAQLIRVKSDE